MTNVEKALSIFDEGFVCSQAVLKTYAARFGMPSESAMKIATAFGGGMACTAEICGAVSGALMVIGLAHGRTELADKAAKAKTYELSRKLINRLQTRYGSIVCKQILGADISTEEGMTKAVETKLFETTCRGCIQYTIETLDEIL